VRVHRVFKKIKRNEGKEEEDDNSVLSREQSSVVEESRKEIPIENKKQPVSDDYIDLDSIMLSK
jgi:hypothetical protein